MRTAIALAAFLTMWLIPIRALGAWPNDAKPFARATLIAKSGSEVTGTVDFAKTSKALYVKAYLGKTPPGKHGFHIHEVGNCDGADAGAVGDHYNPTGSKHAGPKAASRHAGDLGNVEVDAKGDGYLETSIANPSSAGFKGWDDIVGRAVILHGAADDLKSQPAGNSGAKIACGVIRSVTPEAE